MTAVEVWIPLTRGKVTVIDFDDFEKVRSYKWSASNKGSNYYATRRINDTKQQLLHRFIFGEENIPPGFEIAHKDGDGLNNRRSTNLKCCTHAQNMQGKKKKGPNATSQFRGVYRFKRIPAWVAQIKIGGVGRYLGRFQDEVAAAKAYDVKAREMFGEHAACNFPKEVSNAK